MGEGDYLFLEAEARGGGEGSLDTSVEQHEKIGLEKNVHAVMLILFLSRARTVSQCRVSDLHFPHVQYRSATGG